MIMVAVVTVVMVVVVMVVTVVTVVMVVVVMVVRIVKTHSKGKGYIDHMTLLSLLGYMIYYVAKAT